MLSENENGEPKVMVLEEMEVNTPVYII